MTVAANYAVAAIGTETAGSILSPASQNAVVGLKPTIGVLSRSGIVPISSTLDTPGPMTKNVIDNAILMDALIGLDTQDTASKAIKTNYVQATLTATLAEKKIGVLQPFLSDSLYAQAVDNLRTAGATLIEITPEQIPLPGFLTLLNLDMKKDLPTYLKTYASEQVSITSIADAVAFNTKDTTLHIPYGQQLFEGILADTTSVTRFNQIKETLHTNGKAYFDPHFETHTLDAILSINNFHAAYAAVAQYPALTLSMGYTPEGQPKGLTFIGKPFSETLLLELAASYEKETEHRKIPEGYID